MSQFLASRTGEGVRGGSPARPRPAASASPMPRVLLSAAGLSGSASRLSGGAAGTGLSTTRLATSYSALGSSASSGYGSCAGVAVASSTRHEDSEDLSDVSSGAASEDSARRRRRRSAQSMKGDGHEAHHLPACLSNISCLYLASRQCCPPLSPSLPLRPSLGTRTPCSSSPLHLPDHPSIRPFLPFSFSPPTPAM